MLHVWVCFSLPATIKDGGTTADENHIERRSASKGDPCLETPRTSSRFQCLECQRTFGRIEHLTRHSRSHMQERYLKCSVCRKGFYRMSVPSSILHVMRIVLDPVVASELLKSYQLYIHSSLSNVRFSDALRRHEQTHKEPRRSALAKGGRACITCATARRKCSGETKCSGCQKRSLECKYPDGIRRAAAEYVDVHLCSIVLLGSEQEPKDETSTY
jgi:hypothetical protein